MERYTIYCTEEQIKKALELGAPIQKYASYYTVAPHTHICHVKDLDNLFIIPTAEQMIGWLEEQEEINETESTFDQLHNYLENATQEQLDKDWEELKQYNEVGPDVVDLVEQNAYKAGYDAAMEEFKLFLYKCNFCSTSHHVYSLIEEKLKELEDYEK